jgi:hypothetical protein
MKRRLLVLALATLTGCTADKGKGSWAEVVKDARGDNMRMQSGELNMKDSKPAATEKLFD